MSIEGGDSENSLSTVSSRLRDLQHRLSLHRKKKKEEREKTEIWKKNKTLCQNHSYFVDMFITLYLTREQFRYLPEINAFFHSFR